MDERAAGDTYAVAKVAIALATSSIIITDLAEIARTLSVVHLVEDIGLHQPEALSLTASLETGQRHVHHLGSSHIVDAPRIRHPVGGGDGVVFRVFNTNLRDMHVHPRDSLPSLFRSAGTAVDRSIYRPNRRTLMQTPQSHSVLILSPYAFIIQPKPLIHRLEYSFSLLLVGRSVLTNNLRYTCSEQVAPIVISRRMGHSPTIVVECITGPDAAVGIVEVVTIRVVVAFLPGQMALNHWP